MILGAGSWPWPQSSQSWKDPRKDTGTSGDRGTGTEASGDSGIGIEAEASGDSEEAATRVTDFRTKARRGVLVKPSVSRARGIRRA